MNTEGIVFEDMSKNVVHFDQKVYVTVSTEVCFPSLKFSVVLYITLFSKRVALMSI